VQTVLSGRILAPVALAAKHNIQVFYLISCLIMYGLAHMWYSPPALEEMTGSFGLVSSTTSPVSWSHYVGFQV
jgi:hypothetical protein